MQHYLNTDLEVRSDADLGPLIDALEAQLDVTFRGTLPDGGSYLNAHALGSGDLLDPGSTPQRDLRSMLDALEMLDCAAASCLRGTRSIVFDIGWASDHARPEGRFELPAPLLGRLAGLGARLVVTGYPADENA